MTKDTKRNAIIFAVFLAVAIPFFIWLKKDTEEDMDRPHKRKGWGASCTGNNECDGRYCMDGRCTQTCSKDANCPSGTCVEAEARYGDKRLTGIKLCSP
ncbi:MAG: hypothetical protein IT370_12985 [Deltaproteobacteria bacterium]|nr:hypothetical protein [Deltaproteobacteria bacterium]